MSEQKISSSKRHIVVYISGPLTTDTINEWWANTMDAREYCMSLWRWGVTPICPHLNSLLMEGIATYEEFILGDLELVKRSDAVLMIGSWDNSKGAKQERDYALTIGKPVFTTMTDLFEWVEKQPPENEEEER